MAKKRIVRSVQPVDLEALHQSCGYNVVHNLRELTVDSDVGSPVGSAPSEVEPVETDLDDQPIEMLLNKSDTSEKSATSSSSEKSVERLQSPAKQIIQISQKSPDKKPNDDEVMDIQVKNEIMEQTVSPRVNPTAQPKLVPKYRAIPISQLQNGTTQKTIKLLNGTIIKGTFLKAGAIGKPITIINSNGNLRGVPLKQAPGLKPLAIAPGARIVSAPQVVTVPKRTISTQNKSANNNAEIISFAEKTEPVDDSIEEIDSKTTDDNFNFYMGNEEETEDSLNYDEEGLPRRKRRYVARHECQICFKRFVRPAELQRHERIHTGEKPFSCPICCQRFIRKDHLSSHMISHSTDTYCCNLCNFKTQRSDSFRRHQRRHELELESNRTLVEENIESDPIEHMEFDPLALPDFETQRKAVGLSHIAPISNDTSE